jgi:hypothetical protein
VSGPPEFASLSKRIAPVGTRLRKAAATEDGGEGVFGSAFARLAGQEAGPLPRLIVPPPLNRPSENIKPDGALCIPAEAAGE